MTGAIRTPGGTMVRPMLALCLLLHAASCSTGSGQSTADSNVIWNLDAASDSTTGLPDTTGDHAVAVDAAENIPADGAATDTRQGDLLHDEKAPEVGSDGAGNVDAADIEATGPDGQAPSDVGDVQTPEDVDDTQTPEDADDAQATADMGDAQAPADVDDAQVLEEVADVQPPEDAAEDVQQPEDTGPVGCSPGAPGTGLSPASAPAFSAAISQPSPVFRTLTDNGKQYYPDSAVTFRNTGGQWEVTIAVTKDTYRLTGPSPTSVSLNPGSPILSPTGNTATPHHGYAGITSVTTCDGVLTAFFHAEYHAIPVAPWPACPAPYHASMCRATAPGGGPSFSVDSPTWVLTSSGTASYGAPKCAYGAGGGSIFDPGGDYLYLYYYDWDAPNGIYLARTCRSDCGKAGTWRKYANGSFSGEAFSTSFLEPSGPSSAIIPSSGGFDAFPTVSYNTYLDAYLMVSATESGFSLRASADGINWGPRFDLLRHIKAADVELPVYYPTVVDAASWSRDLTGRNLKLVHATVCDDTGKQASHRAFIADIELTKSGDIKTVSYDRRKMVRYFHNASPFDHWCTTAPVPGYASEGGLGKLAANSLPGTHPLYDCVQGQDHLVSQFSSCEGGTTLGIMGFAWSSPGPGLHAVYRCWLKSPEGTVDHFVSLDPGCEGVNNEGAIGWLE